LLHGDLGAGRVPLLGATIRVDVTHAALNVRVFAAGGTMRLVARTRIDYDSIDEPLLSLSLSAQVCMDMEVYVHTAR
jgi:hypothetical protein